MIVVAALIEDKDKILIAKRSTGNPEILGKWEFPGGKVEVGETEFKALEREMKEEFDIEVKTKKFIVNSVCKSPTNEINLKLYKCEYISGSFKLHAHSEFKWVNKEDLLTYDLAPADIPLARYIKEEKHEIN